MSVQEIINKKILKDFCPNHFTIVNESHLHGGPSQESHFKITVVSEVFSGVARVKRHQKIYKSLEDEMSQGIHALALHRHHTGAVPACDPKARKIIFL